MKNKILLALLACAFSAAAASAEGFRLEGVSLSDVQAYPSGTRVAPPVQIKPAPGDEDVLIGVDMTIRIPFGAVKKALQKVAAEDNRIALVDPAKPVLVRSGEFLKVVNLSVDAGGTRVTPVLTLRPYFEGKDKLAVKIQKVQFHLSASPDVKSIEPAFDKDEMMAKVMDAVMEGITTALDKSLKKQKSQYKAADVLKMSYDKAGWVLHAELSMKFLRQYIPPALVGDFHLNAFTFNDSRIFIQFGTDY